MYTYFFFLYIYKIFLRAGQLRRKYVCWNVQNKTFQKRELNRIRI
jgi:hypothetical protein